MHSIETRALPLLLLSLWVICFREHLYCVLCFALCFLHSHTHTEKLSARGRSADAGRDVDSVHKRLVYKRSLFAAAASAIVVVDVVVASAFVTRDTKEISSSETCNAPYKFHYQFQLFYTFLYVFMYNYT